jgi:hypothetical protein
MSLVILQYLYSLQIKGDSNKKFLLNNIYAVEHCFGDSARSFRRLTVLLNKPVDSMTEFYHRIMEAGESGGEDTGMSRNKK